MSDIMRRPWLRYGCACLLVAGALTGTACIQGAQAQEAVDQDDQVQAQGLHYMAPVADKTIVGVTSDWVVNGITQPKVRVYADGRLAQLTPSMTGIYDSEGRVNSMYVNPSFNTEWLKADERGCAACHDDLAELVDNFSSYPHLLVGSGVDTPLGYSQCTICHYDAPGLAGMGTMIHAIHAGVADCFNCHASADPDGSMPVWDLGKYDELKGISSVPNLEGEFTWDQDTITPTDDLFNAGWLGDDMARVRFDDSHETIPIDQETFDTWAISVTGAVDNEMTWSLPELIEQAPSVTTAMKIHCDINPLGGSMIGQVEVTGIPVAWMLEQAGLSDDAMGVHYIDCEGSGNSDSHAMSLHDLTEHEALVVYEINGEPLRWEHGYPVQVWIGEDYAARYTKQVAEIRVGTETPQEIMPQAMGHARGYDKPNVGIVGVLEGQCFQAGEPVTFEGYADAFEQHIMSVEFSMDGGETWQVCYTPGSDASRWVYWHFTWTPPADRDAAYRLQIRARTTEGRTTPVPLDYMFNAKADLAQFTEDVMAHI